MEVFKLFGSILVDTGKAEESISKTELKTVSLGKKLGNGIKTAAKWGAGIVAAAGVGAAALGKMATSTAATTDNIDKMSQKIGISREAYQELDFICSQSGASVDNLKAGMKTLTNQMQSAQQGSASATAAFSALGLSWENGAGKLKSQEEMMWEAFSALQAMDDQTQKAALATDLFGKAGTDLMPMLNGSTGSIQTMKQQAHDLGLVLSDETIDAGVKFTDTMDQAKRSLSAIATNVGAAVMPIFQKMLDYVIEHMPEIQTVCGKVFSGVASLWEKVLSPTIGFLLDSADGVVAFFRTYWPEISVVVKTAFDGIKTIWNTVLKPALDAIHTLLTTVLAPAFRTVFNGIILPVVKEAFGGIKNLWIGSIKPMFEGITDFITGVFTGNWRKAFEGLGKIVQGVFNGLVAIVKTPLNSVIRMVNKFIGGLNKISIPDWVPGVGGKGINISEIPLLATGGNIIKAGKAIVGEAGAELIDLPAGATVTPLSRNQRNIFASDEIAEILFLILAEVRKLNENLYDIIIDAMVNGVKWKMNGRELGRWVRANG